MKKLNFFKQFTDTVSLVYETKTNNDSLVYETKTNDVYEDFCKNKVSLILGSIHNIQSFTMQQTKE